VDWATICTRISTNPNDADAWNALEVRIRVWALGHLGDLQGEFVEDAIADMCSSVVLDVSSARGPETFRGFVLGKCLNVAKGARRRVVPGRTPLDVGMPLAGTPSTDAEDARYRVLDDCLARLPERHRRAVELRYYADAGAEQIARDLGVTTVNARQIVFTGLTRLRRCAQAVVGRQPTSMRG
jgi:RNA polymerase sigma factor (sigma-70 family)